MRTIQALIYIFIRGKVNVKISTQIIKGILQTPVPMVLIDCSQQKINPFNDVLIDGGHAEIF